MKKFMILAAACAMAFSSCNGGSAAGSKGNGNKGEIDSVSRAFGITFGYGLRQTDSMNHLGLNADAVAAGFKEAFSGKNKMTPEQADDYLREYFMVRMPARALAESQAFLEQVEKENKNVRKTESGLLYEIIEPGSEVKAVSNEDVVRVMYEGRLKDGTVFDSSYERGDTVEFPLNQVIKGWTEGMKLVGEGGKIKLWIPSELGYGMRAPQVIGPNQALVFEVELVKVTPAAEEE